MEQMQQSLSALRHACELMSEQIMSVEAEDAAQTERLMRAFADAVGTPEECWTWRGETWRNLEDRLQTAKADMIRAQRRARIERRRRKNAEEYLHQIVFRHYRQVDDDEHDDEIRQQNSPFLQIRRLQSPSPTLYRPFPFDQETRPAYPSLTSILHKLHCAKNILISLNCV